VKFQINLNDQLTSRNRIAKVLLLAAVVTALVSPELALAQVGGGTGSGAAVSARVNSIFSTWQGIMFSLGAFALSGAFMYVGYGMGWGQKKWSDVANVAYGAAVAGGGVMLVSWLFM